VTDTPQPAQPDDASGLHTTSFLLTRMKAGDERAVEVLFTRLIPVLRRMARGRIPARARSLMDTDDLVQIVALRAFPHLSHFDSHDKGCLVAYARRIMTNELRDEFRRLSRTPEMSELVDEIPADDVDPLQHAIESEAIAIYRSALVQLTQDEQDLILLSLELQLSHGEVAEAMGRPTANAARMAVARALARLAERMGWPEETP
jgi:RNA polymerase sigma factor (sigma-70 family)